jgi:hypothetical protein
VLFAGSLENSGDGIVVRLDSATDCDRGQFGRGARERALQVGGFIGRLLSGLWISADGDQYDFGVQAPRRPARHGHRGFCQHRTVHG